MLTLGAVNSGKSLTLWEWIEYGQGNININEGSSALLIGWSLHLSEFLPGGVLYLLVRSSIYMLTLPTLNISFTRKKNSRKEIRTLKSFVRINTGISAQAHIFIYIFKYWLQKCVFLILYEVTSYNAPNVLHI